MNWHLLSIHEIAELLNSTSSGIDNSIAAERLSEYGKNEIEDKRNRLANNPAPIDRLHDSRFGRGSHHIRNPGRFDRHPNHSCHNYPQCQRGFYSEYRSEKGDASPEEHRFQAMQELYVKAKHWRNPSSRTAIPGDVVLLEAGNIIPADVRFFETHQIKVDESTLTGESHNVEKNSSIASRWRLFAWRPNQHGIQGNPLTDADLLMSWQPE